MIEHLLCADRFEEGKVIAAKMGLPAWQTPGKPLFGARLTVLIRVDMAIQAGLNYHSIARAYASRAYRDALLGVGIPASMSPQRRLLWQCLELFP